MANEYEINSQTTAISHRTLSTACGSIHCQSVLVAKSSCAMGILILIIYNGQYNHTTVSLAPGISHLPLIELSSRALNRA